MNNKSTTYQFKEKRNWHLVDAKTDYLGRLSTNISKLLQGKHKSCYAPQLDCGDYVVVLNTRFLKVIHPAKLERKTYVSYSGYPGGIRKINLKKLTECNPNEVIRKAVFNMLPKNKLRALRLNRLKLFQEEKEGRELYEAMKKKVD